MVFLIHTAVTFGLVGLIWPIQLVQYPLFQWVDAESFPRYHFEHCRRIGWVVGPLMLTELLTAAWLMATAPSWLLGLSLGPLALNWLSTAFLQVPLHNRLRSGKDLTVIHSLIRSNWIRTFAWSVRGILIGTLAAS